MRFGGFRNVVGVSLVAGICSVAGTDRAQAGTFVVNNFADGTDAATGISTGTTYTHLVDINKDADTADINGVVFDNTLANYSLTGAGGNFTGWTPDASVTGTGIKHLLNNFLYNGKPAVLTVSGLTPGLQYKLRIYVCGWKGTLVTFSYDDTAPATVVAGQDRGAGQNLPSSFDYTYTLDPGATDLAVTISPDNGTDTMHLYGFSNEEALQSGIGFSGLVASNITTTAASLHATVNTNLTSATVVWDTEDKGDTNLLAWAGSGSASGSTPGAISGNATSLSADTLYTYRFYGENATTSGWSQVATFATSLTAAQKPAFTSNSASFYSITLEWTDNANTETGYVLRRSINDVDYAVVAELDENTTTHTDRGLLSGTTYYYQLAATNDVNESGTAFSACATSATTLQLAAPWTPAYTNTALWLDAADASTILMSGSSVTNWSDKSGNGRDANQNTATKQPLYSATGFSGVPTLVFASGDEMTAGIAPGTFSLAINVYMVIVKHGYDHYDSYPFLRLSSGKAAPFRGHWSNTSSGYWNYRYVGNGSAETGFGRFNNFPAVDTPLLLSVAIDGTTYTEMYNAVNAWSGAHGGTYGDTASDVIVGRNKAGYSISEVVITDSILSARGRQTMEGYLAWKWGMEGNLPGGHLYKDAPPLAPPAAGAVFIVR